MAAKKSTVLFSIVLLISAVFYSFYALMPGKSWQADKILPGYSMDRALTDLEQISQKPHFTGTAEHAHVRNYLVKELEALGLTVEIQEQVAINKKWRAATNTRNILTRIEGENSGNALLLLSHYDSSPHSAIGASDAGSGIVIILEAVRAYLSQGLKPQNDIIICFSDAEELGLLGANAFVNNHPWAKDIGLVLNLEARGSGGPSYMLMETNGGNKKLVEAFDKANMEFPLGNSLMYSIYKMLPNDTDLTVFREDGDISGFNFAFIGDHFDYHTEQDTFERMDRNSFLHQTSYLLAGLTYFSEADLTSFASETDYVYFDFPILGMVYYPFSWVIPWLLLCTLGFVVLMYVGFKKQRITLSGAMAGLWRFVLVMLITGLTAYYGWKLLLFIHPQYNDILHGFTYNGYYYIAFFVSLTITICFLMYKGLFVKRSLEDLMIAPIFIWLLINAGVGYYLLGAGFFIIPVTTLLIALAVLVFSNRKSTLLLFTVLSIPTLFIFAPMVKMFPVGLGLEMMIISALFTTLLFGFLIPVIYNYGGIKKGIGIFALLSLIFLVVAETKADYSPDRKAPNSIIYVLDSNTNEAYWRTYNNRLDAFTSQFFENDTEEGSFYEQGTASKYGTKTRQFSKAPLVDLQKPNMFIAKDTIVDASREITLVIDSKRDANKIELMANVPIKFKVLKVNGVALPPNASAYVLEVQGGTIMSYYLTSVNEILTIEFVLDPDQEFNLDILEAKFDLMSNTAFDIQQRSEEMMPMPFVLNDATIIKTTLNIE